MPNILFMCIANRCRSPMAEALFKAKLAQEGLEGWRVESAGTWAHDGLPAATYAVLALREIGLDIGDHRARLVSEELLRAFDLVLTLEAGQREALGVEFPQFADRVHMLSAMAGAPYDVRDPEGADLGPYRATREEIAGLIERGFERIQTLAQNPTTPQKGPP